MQRFRMSGDESVGLFEPDDVHGPDFERASPETLERLRACTGLTPTTSDVLDELGWLTSVPAGWVAPRHLDSRPLVGQAQTLAYLPTRRHVSYPGSDAVPPKLAHQVVYRQALPGDVMVIAAPTPEPVSTMGGIAARQAVDAGLGGVLVDGSVRDIDQIRASGLPIWTRSLTPRAGKARLEAASVNARVVFAGIQVQPGDVVVADATGICFVPIEVAEAVFARVLEVSEDELRATGRGR
jgi:4-hydroxy-4-methyl-2-oxoglutarate aldolase